MKRREVKGAPSTDLLVCFPTRSHLTMMPKMICSPSRTSNSHPSHHQRGKSIGDHSGLWSQKNQIGSESSEPTSPKVTCVGQIKARPNSGPCKNWQSVMEEIERFHHNKKDRKKHNWGGALGFKKESMQFLTCLRNFKFDLGCFGAFPNTNVTSDDDDEDEDDDDDDDEEIKHEKKMGIGGYDQDLDDHEEGSSKSEFSKWLLVLEDNQDCGLDVNEESSKPKDDQDEVLASSVPPPNALLLMRCRSTPTKSWSKEKREDDDSEDDSDKHDDDENEDGNKSENSFELMKYEGDFYKLSCDIAKETWVVGGINKDPSSRTQSSRRCSAKCLQEVKACLQ